MSSMLDRFYERSAHLSTLLDNDPAEAIRQAREIDLDKPDRFNMMSLQAAILVDGGALTQQQDAIEERLALFRDLLRRSPSVEIVYNLANGLIATAGFPPKDASWLDHQERTREHRAEARRCLWKASQDLDADSSLRTQAWTNLGSQFSNTFRLGEAHDAWLAALAIDPENGVAAPHRAICCGFMRKVLVLTSRVSKRQCWPRSPIDTRIELFNTLVRRLQNKSLHSPMNLRIRHRAHFTMIHSSCGSSANV